MPANLLVYPFVLLLASLAHIHTIKAEENFLHLLDAANTNRRLHISSEIVQNGHRIDTEEFLDLETLNQLIQIKWFDERPNNSSEDQSADLRRMRKVNIVVLNSDQKKSFIYRYEPFTCTLNELTCSDSASQPPNAGWQQFKGPFDADEEANLIYNTLIESIVSTAPDSPYLTRLEAQHGSWMLGVSALWAKAQFSGSPPGPASSGSGAWRIKSHGLLIDYFMDSFMLASDTAQGVKEQLIGDGEPNIEQCDAPSLIEIKDESDEKTIQVINIFQVEYNFSDQLAQNLFKLPIGFNCPPNPYLDKNNFYSSDQTSQLVKLEIVANKYAGFHSESIYSETQIKNVEIAHLKHPIDHSSSLLMFHSLEDRFKLVSDYYYLLDYRVQFVGPAHDRCTIKRLNYGQTLYFDNNIVLDLNQAHLNYLLNIEQLDNVMDEMRLLNIFKVNEANNEIIFESEVAPAYKEMLKLTDSSGHYADRQMTLVRVYGQQIERARRSPGGSIELKRVLILVFDANRSKKLAEIRLNLVDEMKQMISYSKRANLFDLSACFDRREQTMELVVTYAADPNLVEFAQEQAQELIDRFYQSAHDWRLIGNVSRSGDTKAELEAEEGALEKERLGLSLNFLRMPRVELSGSPGGDLEFRISLLDKVSPLKSFTRVERSTFVTVSGQNNSVGKDNEDISSLLLESVEECARFCQLFNCKVFSYNSNSECRFTHLPLSKWPRLSDGTAETRAVKMTLDSSGQVYFEPQWLSDKRYKEATLADLAAYLDHFSAELAAHHQSNSQDGPNEEDISIPLNRTKRAASRMEISQPLFSFAFVDKSNLRNEYAPPTLRMLAPSELSITHLPLALDVSESSQIARVGKSFRVTTRGSMYHIAASGGEESKGRGERQEATFIDQQNNCYYTLKMVHGIEQDNCALLCFNMDEWNARTNSQQLCVSFSYSRPAELCVLAVQTDLGFVNSVSELVELHEEEEELTKVDSLSKLLVSHYDGIVATRNHLQDYEGPIRMAPGVHGYATTEAFEFGLELEWLQAKVVDSSEPQDEERESCAARCAARNKLAKQTCVAFDYCSTKSRPAQNISPRYQVLCDLLLVSGPNMANDRQKMANLRDHLSQKTEPPTRGNQLQESLPKNHVILSNSCNRYLWSHLHDFTHLSRRQLVAERTADKLEIIDEPWSSINLDRCALECSLRSEQCVLFEFCMFVDAEAEAEAEKKLTRSCTMYKSAPAKTAEPKENLNQPEAKLSGLTSYNRNCHLYLRKQFGSIEEAIQHKEVASPTRKGEFEHARLSMWFVILYLSMIVGFIAYFVRNNNLAVRERLGKVVRGINERYLARR